MKNTSGCSIIFFSIVDQLFKNLLHFFSFLSIKRTPIAFNRVFPYQESYISRTRLIRFTY